MSENGYSQLMVGGRNFIELKLDLQEPADWKEDHRRLANGELATRTLGLALVHPVSREWSGYWQRAA